MREDLITLEVCRIYGWTYYDYMTQPIWFTELAVEKALIDSLRAKAARDTVQ